MMKVIIKLKCNVSVDIYHKVLNVKIRGKYVILELCDTYVLTRLSILVKSVEVLEVSTDELE